MRLQAAYFASTILNHPLRSEAPFLTSPSRSYFYDDDAVWADLIPGHLKEAGIWAVGISETN